MGCSEAYHAIDRTGLAVIVPRDLLRNARTSGMRVTGYVDASLLPWVIDGQIQELAEVEERRSAKTSRSVQRRKAVQKKGKR